MKKTFCGRCARALTPCPSVTALSSYIDGRLTGIERVLVEQHLQTCCACRDIVDVVRWSIAQVEDEAERLEER